MMNNLCLRLLFQFHRASSSSNKSISNIVNTLCSVSKILASNWEWPESYCLYYLGILQVEKGSSEFSSINIHTCIDEEEILLVFL